MRARLDEFGLQITTLRRRQRLSQDALAELVGISASHLSHLETGRRRASQRVTRRLAGVLGVPPSLLFRAAGKLELDFRLHEAEPERASEPAVAFNITGTADQVRLVQLFWDFVRYANLPAGFKLEDASPTPVSHPAVSLKHAPN